jgi:hypothetical protein
LPTQGKRILELGSGTGLLGISLLKSLDVKEYTFTDCHFNVINFLIYNLELNFNKYRDLDSLARQCDEGPPAVVRGCVHLHFNLQFIPASLWPLWHA